MKHRAENKTAAGAGRGKREAIFKVSGVDFMSKGRFFNKYASSGAHAGSETFRCRPLRPNSLNLTNNLR